MAAAAIALVLVSGASLLQMSGMGLHRMQPVSASEPPLKEPDFPFAQMRIEDENSVKVQYVRPELLQSIEFETNSSSQ